MSFQDEVLPLLERDIENLHNGDVKPRKELWSHADPVVLFGAHLGAVGWTEIDRTFDEVASWFHGSRYLDIEVVAAESSGDLGYVCAIERSEVVVAEGRTKSYSLRVTTVFRREHGTWLMVHRHASAYDEQSRDTVESLG
jgi:ketosteroid isomerase-like protein